MADKRAAYIGMMEAVLDDFQWAFPDRSENRGEVYVEDDQLVLVVYVRDNESPDNEDVHPLRVTTDLNIYQDPQVAVRELIHMFLCHEADEQIWFGNERPFYPHEEA